MRIGLRVVVSGSWLQDRWWPKPMQPAERAELSGFAPKLAAE